ncbi:hypothetical protein GJ496_003190 [Pomphorhynchus laevis]|nr:hypothetical protein GJ496_003190 [Pomphorhynchus laevis]
MSHSPLSFYNNVEGRVTQTWNRHELSRRLSAPSLPNWCGASVQQSHTDCVVEDHMLVWLDKFEPLSINAQKLAYSAKNSTRCPTDNSNASLYVIVGNCIGRQQRTGINFPAFHFRRWYFRFLHRQIAITRTVLHFCSTKPLSFNVITSR